MFDKPTLLQSFSNIPWTESVVKVQEGKCTRLCIRNQMIVLCGTIQWYRYDDTWIPLLCHNSQTLGYTIQSAIVALKSPVYMTINQYCC